MGFSCTHEKRYFIGRYLILGVWPHACFLFKQHLSWRKEKEIKIWILIRATVSWLWTVLACGPCWGLIGKLVSWHDLQIKKIIKKKKNFSRSVNQKAYGGMVHHVVGPASASIFGGSTRPIKACILQALAQHGWWPADLPIFSPVQLTASSIFMGSNIFYNKWDGCRWTAYPNCYDDCVNPLMIN